jgi:molecular chaperone HtpG
LHLERAVETHRFEADVRQILHLVTHSLYSDREIFLRELVSNASDALDRARFLGLQREDLRPVSGEPSIRLTVDSATRTITISDDGVGLTREEAQQHLGTIAQSGTRAFARALKEKGESGSDDTLIGQFGVGFYSAFMVADKVVVESLSALPGSEAIRWISDGGESYELSPGQRSQRGTDIVLHLREDSGDFLDADKLRDIVRKHSDYISWPIQVDGERANQEAALWTRSPSEISDEEYSAFYKHLSGDWQDPLVRVHMRAEGNLQFQAVLFIPHRRPYELDRLDYKIGLKLYQKRVKILDSAEALLPKFLRFVSGMVDAPDVDLNVSREILQQTPVLQAIKKQLTRRILKRLKEVSNAEPEAYETFWKEFGHILKEGIHEDTGDHKELLTQLLRFKTTRSEGAPRSLAQIKADKPTEQEDIWYYTSVDKERIGSAPVLEAFKKKGWEVLLMDDPVDEWVVMNVRDFEGVKLKSVTHGDAPGLEPDKDDPIAKAARDQAAPLADWMKTLLGDSVAEVRLSNRLTESPSVLVDQEGAMGANLERILKAANQNVPAGRRVLEINAEHPLVKTLARLNLEGKQGLEPFARLLLDHAAITEGRLDDPQGFAGRLQALMERAASGL